MLYFIFQMQLAFKDVFPSEPYLLLWFEEISLNNVQGNQDCVLFCYISISRYIVLVAISKLDTFIIVG